jgi:hypothetical protein
MYRTVLVVKSSSITTVKIETEINIFGDVSKCFEIKYNQDSSVSIVTRLWA